MATLLGASQRWTSPSPHNCTLALQGLTAAALSAFLFIENKPFSPLPLAVWAEDWTSAEDGASGFSPLSFKEAHAFLQAISEESYRDTFGTRAGRRVKVKASVNSALAGLVAFSRPWRGLAWDRPTGNRPPPGIYRSESEKEEGLVHLHTSISSPATRWDSVWIRDSLDARNSTARSQTRFMRLLEREGLGSAGQPAWGSELPRARLLHKLGTSLQDPVQNASAGGKGIRY